MGKFKVGDKVEVVPGVIDHDFKIDIGGWSGSVARTFILDEDHKTEMCTVIWDKKTIDKMGWKLIRQCDRMNLNHTEMNLAVTELAFQPFGAK